MANEVIRIHEQFYSPARHSGCEARPTTGTTLT